MDGIQQAKVLIESIKELVQAELNKIKFNTKKRALVKDLNEDGTANIIMNDAIYNNVKIRIGLSPKVNEVVWVEIPNGNIKNAYIDSAKQTSTIIGNKDIVQELNAIQILQDWQSIVLQNGWIADSNIGIKYFKHLGIVYLNIRLIVGNGNNGTILGTLPQGYRPISNLILPVYKISDNTINYLVILTNGNIQVSENTIFNSGDLYMSTFSFRADG